MSPACCPSGSWPQLLRSKAELNAADEQQTPKGAVHSIAVPGQEKALPVYLVKPPADAKVIGTIMVLPDIYSVRVLDPAVRSGDRIGGICDMLAAAGYVVALCGVFRDRPFDLAVAAPAEGVDFEKFDCFAAEGGVDWFKEHSYAKVGPCVQACAAFLKEQAAPANVTMGVLGFCFGTWLLSKASSTGDVDFAAAVGCHPATTLEAAVHGGDEIAMMRSLQQPTRFLWAGNDSDIYVKDGAGKAALEASGGDVVEFPNMLHGWVSRGDTNNEQVKADVKTAVESMMEFFGAHMSKKE